MISHARQALLLTFQLAVIGDWIVQRIHFTIVIHRRHVEARIIYVVAWKPSTLPVKLSIPPTRRIAIVDFDDLIGAKGEAIWIFGGEVMECHNVAFKGDPTIFAHVGCVIATDRATCRSEVGLLIFFDKGVRLDNATSSGASGRALWAS
jgi:hypothetical protein